MKLKLFDWIVSLLIGVALANWLTFFWFDFNMVTWLSFGMRWLEGTIYTIVGVLGFIGLGRLLWAGVTKVAR